MILPAEEDRENADPSRRLVHVEPADRAVDRQMADAVQDVWPKRAAEREARLTIGRPADLEDRRPACVEAASALPPTPI